MRSAGLIRFSFAAATLVASVLASPSSGAEGNALAGCWICRSDDLRVEMEFTESGRCLATAKCGERTSRLDAKYKLGPREVVLTPSVGEPIVYHTTFEGEKLKLTGGDLGKLGLLLVRRSADAEANTDVEAPAAKQALLAPAAVPLAKDKKPADDKKPGDGKKLPVEGDAKLPGGKWEVQSLEKRAAIVKVRYDDVKSVVTFIVDVRENNYLAVAAKFYDEDGVQIADQNFAPEGQGTRLRLTLTLPAEAVMKKCVKVVVAPSN